MPGGEDKAQFLFRAAPPPAGDGEADQLTPGARTRAQPGYVPRLDTCHVLTRGADIVGSGPKLHIMVMKFTLFCFVCIISRLDIPSVKKKMLHINASLLL